MKDAEGSGRRSTDSIQKRIVTAESMPEAMMESADAEATATGGRLRQERYRQIKTRLKQEAAVVGEGLMITVPDREVSRMQSELARRKAIEQKAASGGLEVKFGTGIGGGDWFGWIASLFDWVDRKDAHPLVRPKTTTARPLPDKAKVGLTADWGTALYGAPKIAEQLRKEGSFDLLMHLGDIYYSGTREEVQERFLDVWPQDAGTVTRTLNSNHEMYSGGYGYFELALPALEQDSSYFAFKNADWLLIGLDTAYVDHDIDNEQVAWLNLVIQESNRERPRKVILFSHQQLFSRLDHQGPKLEHALRHLLEAKAITAWYWGHEHQCVIYDPHPRYGLLGRCLGNGGIPELRKDEVKKAPAESTVGPIVWKRLAATGASPGCLALDGPNRDIEKGDKFVPHGYMTLHFDGPKLTERVRLSDGSVLLERQIA